MNSQKEINRILLKSIRMFRAYERELKDSGYPYRFITNETFKEYMSSLNPQQASKVLTAMTIMDKAHTELKKLQYKKTTGK